MKAIKIQLRLVAIFLSALVFFQGCAVYKSSNVTLDQAVMADTKVRIKTNNDQTLKFNRLEFKDGHYFGVNRKYKDDPFNQSKLDIVRIPLNPINIELVQVKNKTLSTILPFAVPIVLMGGLLLIVGVSGGY